MKGTKEIEVKVGTLLVTVECDPDDGYDGDMDDLEEDVQQALYEDIEALTPEGEGWMATAVSVKLG